MTPSRKALDGCTVGETVEGETDGDADGLIGEVYRTIPSEGFTPTGTSIFTALGGGSIEFFLVRPRAEEGAPPETNPPDFVPGLQRSVTAMQTWFVSQVGRQLRIQPGIRHIRLNETSAQIAATGVNVRDRLEMLLRQMGFDNPRTLYAVWYDGVSNHACGGGAWPHGGQTAPDEQTPGHLAALYLRGAFNGVDCAADAFSADGAAPAINEFKMLHEILHTMGLVSPTAPNHVSRGHTSDDPNDLMYAGPLDWRPSVIDANRDDYINDLNRSMWLVPLGIGSRWPAGW
jgi:hypothetical protein